MRVALSLFFSLLVVGAMAHAAEPQRSKGISAHLLPKRVADITGEPWGLHIDYAPHLKPEPKEPVLQTVAEVIAYVKKQDAAVVSNGLWVVTTHPSSYSAKELEFQEQLKKELPKQHIPLFWARAAALEQGFQRY